ncbi:hypothetical protein [Halpernia sp. GG3]
MRKSFRSATTFAHRSADYIRRFVKAFSLPQKPSTHLRIGKIPFLYVTSLQQNETSPIRAPLAEIYIEIVDKLKEIDENYTVLSLFHLDEQKKIFLGDKENRRCRFCGKDCTETTFKKQLIQYLNL